MEYGIQGLAQVLGPTRSLSAEDMKVTGVKEEDAGDRSRWRQMIYCGDEPLSNQIYILYIYTIPDSHEQKRIQKLNLQ